MKCSILIATALTMVPHLLYAYPEFQRYSQERSGRPVNCAMCHISSDGPEGSGHGQIGSLNGEELNRLNQARGAFAPGLAVRSPILNEFGNNIVRVMGKQKFVELRSRPAELPANYGFKSDLDGDGIPDAEEYLDGTQPLNRSHGAPLKIFMHNLIAYRFHILMIALATASGLYGLAHLLRGFSVRMDQSKDAQA